MWDHEDRAVNWEGIVIVVEVIKDLGVETQSATEEQNEKQSKAGDHH
jgi:hypothetical protein